MSKYTRDSNVELLRIISTLGVIILHINSGGKGFSYVSDLFLNYHIMLLVELFFICAVNVFVCKRQITCTFIKSSHIG